MKKVVLRKCIVTQDRYPKQQLIRVVRLPSGEVIIDPTGKANGRGAYVVKTTTAIKKAQKTNVFARVLAAPIPDDLYLKLLELVNE